ncbi:conserved hypothetical protein, ribA/ribD-fused [Andreprevotia lacus DSM 23236]|jgi:ribA/ribD-fused uncharacterized protein|uniref:NADAR domain-containing protein n=1 Tax=Andreprevotia lacus DSM 23236 TaxID=1121001 RepID=A0A1W1XZP3_9NEIS|nr:NADAR family protein [Andreprevotia lacus]SMC29430.1 conserved hypothetical protein, ribA/ribD-fused [Andreprevotia lacus DSM 23236]
MSPPLADLHARIAAGEQPEFLFFWGHRHNKRGGVTAACLSQWFPAGFTLDDVYYHTAEHYMMAAKARLFDDAAILAQILANADPRSVKALGRKIKGYDDARWQAHRYCAVVAGNVGKFGQNAALQQFLLATGDKVLVEASPVDAIWGIGLDQAHPDAAHPARWPGLNLLGFALMDVRGALRRQLGEPARVHPAQPAGQVHTDELHLALRFALPHGGDWQTLPALPLTHDAATPLHTLVLPNHETLEISAWLEDEHLLHLQVRQHGVVLAQLQTEGAPTLAFRTFGHAAVECRLLG